ncbi:hypothetical protein MMC16_001676 [Acarospora aff. strigata]|nr:hypothetical protein [Acarospora aff. strigata]
MDSGSGSFLDHHPADTTYNPGINRHRGRPATYQRSPLSVASTPETVSTSEPPVFDRSNRPRLNIDTSSLPTSPEVSADLADTPHPAREDSPTSTDNVVDSYFQPTVPVTTDSPESDRPMSPIRESESSSEDRPTVTTIADAPESDRPVSPIREDEPPAEDRPVSPISPIARSSTVGPHVRFADEPQPRRALTSLEQHRETLRTIIQDFNKIILEPGEEEPDWMKFRGALMPAAETLTANQIIQALKHHLPSVQHSQWQNAQLRNALEATQRQRDEDQPELERLRSENEGLQGALNRLQIHGEEGQQVKDLITENEQLKIQLEAAQKELHESFEDRLIDEGNLRHEIIAMEEELAAQKTTHEAIFNDRQLLRMQVQQNEHNLRRAEEQRDQARQGVASIGVRLQLSQANLRETNNRLAAMETQNSDANRDVQNLREQIFNLEAALQRERASPAPRSPTSPTSPTSPRSPRSRTSPTSQAPTQSTATSSASASNPSPPSSRLQRARQDLVSQNPRLVHKIVDPLEAAGYAKSSIPRRAIHEVTETGLAGAQIVKAISEHLPQIRDRQRLKAAYRRLQIQFEGRGKLITRYRTQGKAELDQMKRNEENKQKEVDAYKARVQVLERKQREAEDAEDAEQGQEEEADIEPEPEWTDAPETPSQGPTTQASTSARNLDALAADYQAAREALRATRSENATLTQQNEAVLATNEILTDQVNHREGEISRLREDLIECQIRHQQLTLKTEELASLKAQLATLTTQLKARDAEVRRLTTDLLECRQQHDRLTAENEELASLRAQITALTTQLATLTSQVAAQTAANEALEIQSDDQLRMIDALRIQFAATDAIRTQHTDESRDHERTIERLRAEVAELREQQREVSPDSVTESVVTPGDGAVITTTTITTGTGTSTTGTGIDTGTLGTQSGGREAQRLGPTGTDALFFWALLALAIVLGAFFVGRTFLIESGGETRG